MMMPPVIAPRSGGPANARVRPLPQPTDTGPVAEFPVETTGTLLMRRRRIDPVREVFSVLTDWWHEATDALSSPDQKARHPAHQRIVAMGHEAVPYILEELRDRGGHWYMALAEITHEMPPIPTGFPSNVRGEKEAWLRWGREQGLVQ